MRKLESDRERILETIGRIGPFLEGSLTKTRKKCGNKKCRCASEGPIHFTTLLTWKEKQVTRTIYIPAEMEAEISKWIEEYGSLKKAIGQMSSLQRTILRKRKAEKL